MKINKVLTAAIIFTVAITNVASAEVARDEFDRINQLFINARQGQQVDAMQAQINGLLARKMTKEDHDKIVQENLTNYKYQNHNKEQFQYFDNKYEAFLAANYAEEISFSRMALYKDKDGNNYYTAAGHRRDGIVEEEMRYILKDQNEVQILTTDYMQKYHIKADSDVLVKDSQEIKAARYAIIDVKGVGTVRIEEKETIHLENSTLLIHNTNNQIFNLQIDASERIELYFLK